MGTTRIRYRAVISHSAKVLECSEERYLLDDHDLFGSQLDEFITVMHDKIILEIKGILLNTTAYVPMQIRFEIQGAMICNRDYTMTIEPEDIQRRNYISCSLFLNRLRTYFVDYAQNDLSYRER